MSGFKGLADCLVTFHQQVQLIMPQAMAQVPTAWTLFLRTFLAFPLIIAAPGTLPQRPYL